MTNGLGFHPRRPSRAYTRLLDDASCAQITSIIQSALGSYQAEEIAHQCVRITHQLQAPVAQALGFDPVVTIGYVDANGRNFYKSSEADLRQWLAHPSRVPRALMLHTWLTLPTMEIIDATLGTTYAVENDRLEDAGRLLLAHPDDLKNGMRYHPIAVGIELLDHISSAHITNYQEY